MRVRGREGLEAALAHERGKSEEQLLLLDKEQAESLAARQSQHGADRLRGFQGREEFEAALAHERGKSEEQLLVLEKAQAASLAAKQSQYEEQIAQVGAKSLKQFWLMSMENLKNSFCWALDSAKSLRQR